MDTRAGESTTRFEDTREDGMALAKARTRVNPTEAMQTMALTIAHRLQECNAAHRGDSRRREGGLTGSRRAGWGAVARGASGPRPRAAVADLGQRPVDHPRVLVRPGPGHDHDVPILTKPRYPLRTSAGGQGSERL